MTYIPNKESNAIIKEIETTLAGNMNIAKAASLSDVEDVLCNTANSIMNKYGLLITYEYSDTTKIGSLIIIDKGVLGSYKTKFDFKLRPGNV